MKTVTNLNWADRLALLNAYNPTDNDASVILGVSCDELATARLLEQAGSIIASTDLNVSDYKDVFTTSSTSTINSRSVQPVVSITRDGSSAQLPALSATKKTTTSVPKKRGRKGTNIAAAFAAVPTHPTNVEQFAQRYNVSVAVLRQGKRFDRNGNGTVNVKRDKASGELRICRVVAKNGA